jgi:hypothetical protein
MRSPSKFLLRAAFLMASIGVSLGNQTLAETDAVKSISPPESGFFAKRLDYMGLPIKASKEVDDAALKEASRRLQMMLGNVPLIRAKLITNGSELHIIGKDQETSDLPECRELKGQVRDDTGLEFDKRTRGVGGKYASCGEENLLHLPKDRYADRDICVHEFAHTLMAYGLDEPTQEKIVEQFRKSTSHGLWKGMYAGSNDKEFFAELTMWYFGTRGDYGKSSQAPSPGPEWLKAYDPEAYQLLNQIYAGPIQPEKWPTPAAVAKPVWPAQGKDGANLVTLHSLAPGAESGLKSTDSAVPTNLVFVNNTDQPAQIFWLNFKGARESYGWLPARKSKQMNTFATHPWVLVDHNGHTVALFVATPQSAVAYLK